MIYVAAIVGEAISTPHTSLMIISGGACRLLDESGTLTIYFDAQYSILRSMRFLSIGGEGTQHGDFFPSAWLDEPFVIPRIASVLRHWPLSISSVAGRVTVITA